MFYLAPSILKLNSSSGVILNHKTSHECRPMYIVEQDVIILFSKNDRDVGLDVGLVEV